MDRCVQRRQTVCACGVDVGALFDERLDVREAAPFGSVHQRNGGRRGRRWQQDGD